LLWSLGGTSASFCYVTIVVNRGLQPLAKPPPFMNIPLDENMVGLPNPDTESALSF